MLTPAFTIGGVSVYHGDCLDVLPTLRGVDAVVTDPPYGVAFKGKATKENKANGVGYGEHVDDAAFVRGVVVPIIADCRHRFGRVVVMPGIRNMFAYPEPDDAGCVYCPAGVGLGRWGWVGFHPILYYGKPPKRGSTPASFESFATAKPNGHPCPKPFAWMKWLVEKATAPGETVLDPFAGSGTTGVACLKTGRECVLIEKDARYIPLIAKRLRDAEMTLFQPVTTEASHQ
jgi:site-specific DNA-methyltransferase (adenine-specific)